MGEQINKAVAVLRKGGVILYPTDTLYGLGVDASNTDALKKLYTIKEREPGKPVSVIVESLEAAASYVEITPLARTLAEKFLPGALTLVLKKVGSDETLAIRIPNSPTCLAIAKQFGKPFTATSANKSNMASLRSVPGILAQLGESANKIDLVIDIGELPNSLPSTVVDVRGEKPIVLREGAIPANLL